eukprot:15453290-Alexandrium_andersonii.AAC.1
MLTRPRRTMARPNARLSTTGATRHPRVPANRPARRVSLPRLPQTAHASAPPAVPTGRTTLRVAGPGVAT